MNENSPADNSGNSNAPADQPPQPADQPPQADVQSQNSSPAPRVPRQFFQLRLRTLLILFTLASLAAWRLFYHPGLNVENVQKLAILKSIEKDVWKVVWSPSGRVAAFVSWEQPVELRDTVTWTKIDEIGAGKKIIHFAFSPDPDIVAYCENGGQAVILNRAAKTTRVLPTGNGQNKLEFSPDGKWLATGRYGKVASVWDVASGKLVSRLATTSTGGMSLDFHPDGKLIAVGNRNGSACIFDAATGKRVAELKGGDNCHQVAFDPSGQILAVAYADGMLRTWDTNSWTMIKQIPSGCSDLYNVNWSERGDMLVTSGKDGKITLWRPNLSVICHRTAPEWVIVGDFTPDGGRLLTAGGAASVKQNRKVDIWGIPTVAADWSFGGAGANAKSQETQTN